MSGVQQLNTNLKHICNIQNLEKVSQGADTSIPCGIQTICVEGLWNVETVYWPDPHYKAFIQASLVDDSKGICGFTSAGTSLKIQHATQTWYSGSQEVATNLQ